MNKNLLRHFNKVEKTHWWWAGRRQLIIQLLGKRPHTILDVGCGTGETLTFLRKKFPKANLYGIDNSKLAIKFAKSRGHKNIKNADAYTLPFPDNFFDVALLLDVLEHFEYDLKLIKEVKRVLKPQGSIIITCPALSFIWSAHDTNQGHFRRYSRRRFCYLAKKAKLKLSFLSYFNFFLSPPIIIIRLLGNSALFSHLNSYNSGLNYDIVKSKTVNGFLKKIFIFETKLLKYITYPFGISIAAKLEKSL